MLVLEDGEEFSGFVFGASPDASETVTLQLGFGEIVFNTSMTGYQEILTDPSYFGQIVCMTTPHIGNTGVNLDDIESKKIWCSGFIVHQFTATSDSWRSSNQLDAYLKDNFIPGLYGVDTRALTLHLRRKGVLTGLIVLEKDKKNAIETLKKLPRLEERDMIQKVSTDKPYIFSKSNSSNPLRVVAMDFGIKTNILRTLHDIGCSVEVVPANISAQEILDKNPDGIFLSNGPGDPKKALYAVETIKSLLGKKPVFGVCMGHQLLSLALGCETYKLKFGHRGGNHPVIDQASRKVSISAHNHGFAVKESSLPEGVIATHINLNDKTVEGIEAAHLNAFSVQYHPEACPGPHDSIDLFNRFRKNILDHVSKIS